METSEVDTYRTRGSMSSTGTPTINFIFTSEEEAEKCKTVSYYIKQLNLLIFRMLVVRMFVCYMFLR